MFSSNLIRRHLLNSAAALLLLPLASTANALQDTPAPTTLQMAVLGWTVTLRLPAAGLFTGEEQILYVRVVQGGADSTDTVPFARFEAKTLLDGSTDKPTDVMQIGW